MAITCNIATQTSILYTRFTPKQILASPMMITQYTQCPESPEEYIPTQCTICQDTRIDQFTAFNCPALHCFHADCIKTWTLSCISESEEITCPQCRRYPIIHHPPTDYWRYAQTAANIQIQQLETENSTLQFENTVLITENDRLTQALLKMDATHSQAITNLVKHHENRLQNCEKELKAQFRIRKLQHQAEMTKVQQEINRKLTFDTLTQSPDAQ